MKIKEGKVRRNSNHDSHTTEITDVFLYDELFNKIKNSIELEHPDWDDDRIIKTVKAILSNHYSYR